MLIKRSPAALVAFAALGILVVVGAYAIYVSQASGASSVPTRFALNGKTFVITDTATTAAQREEGLMGRKVTDTTIMLFVFPSPDYYRFWMYQTNTSLDMIWLSIDGNVGQVVYIVSSAQPCYDQASCTIYAPTASASYVLESKSGFVETNQVRVGDQMTFA